MAEQILRGRSQSREMCLYGSFQIGQQRPESVPLHAAEVCAHHAQLGIRLTSRSRAARIASFRGRQGEASRGGAGKYLDAGRIAVAPRRCDSANVRLNDTTLSKWNLTIVVSLTQPLSEM
jgi:hypothetical protein